MKHKLLSLLFSLLSVTSIYGQKVILTFTSDKDCEIFIYKPIDGGYNEKIPTKRLIVNSTKTSIYETEVSTYMFLYCQFPQYQQSCNILLFPNDSIQVHVSEGNIVFQGSNQAGQQYLYDNFQKYPDLENYMKMQNVITDYIEDKRELPTILPTIDERRGISAHIKAIENLPTQTKTTTEFSNVLKTEISMLFNSDITGLLRYIISKDQKRKIISSNDSILITNQIDSIFKTRPISYELIGYPARITYISRYVDFYYRKKGCPDGYDPDTFGPSMTYLYAPKEMQPALLGNACMVQLKYDTGEMNLSKLKEFFNKEFPDSEYTAIINKQINGEDNSADNSSANFVFIKEKIDSLSQLKSLPELEGKFLYLDLWASWCMPCRGEFSYKEQVDTLLNTYKNIAIVYVSIDQEKQEKAWLNCIKRYKLDGFHLRASPELQQDIQKLIYGTDTYDIPRYILISPTGKILHKNLSRPSNYPGLKKELDDIL